MRYLPIIVGAALLSAGLLAPPAGPTPPCRRCLSIVPTRCHPRSRRSAITGAVGTAIARTTGPITGLTAITVPITVLTATGTATADLIAIATSKRRGHRSGPGERRSPALTFLRLPMCLRRHRAINFCERALLTAQDAC